MPQKMTLRRFSAGTAAAAMPTTMALSPASTRSIATTWPKAASCDQSSADSIFKSLLVQPVFGCFAQVTHL
jgi:hypothetical protein